MSLKDIYREYQYQFFTLQREFGVVLDSIQAKPDIYKLGFPTQIHFRGVRLFLPESLENRLEFVEALVDAVRKGATFEESTDGHGKPAIPVLQINYGNHHMLLGLFPHTSRNTVEEFAEWWNSL